MIPGVNLIDFITYVGIIGVAFVIFAESGLLVGFFLPGDSLLFTTGFLIHAGILNLDIHLVAILLFVAAVVGDSVGYTFGRRVGRKLFQRPNSRLFKQEHLQKAQYFYEKHGGKTILLARFVPIVRTFAPVVAGAGKMKYRTFVIFNLIGGFLWANGITYAGYYLGAWFTSIGLGIDQVLLPIIIVIIFISILPAVIGILKDPKNRRAIWNGIKQQLKVMFGKSKGKKTD